MRINKWKKNRFHVLIVSLLTLIFLLGVTFAIINSQIYNDLERKYGDNLYASVNLYADNIENAIAKDNLDEDFTVILWERSYNVSIDQLTIINPSNRKVVKIADATLPKDTILIKQITVKYFSFNEDITLDYFYNENIDNNLSIVDNDLTIERFGSNNKQRPTLYYTKHSRLLMAISGKDLSQALSHPFTKIVNPIIAIYYN